MGMVTSPWIEEILSGFPDLAACQLLGPVNKRLVKGEESIVPLTGHKVHGIGKIDPFFIHPDNPPCEGVD